MSYKGFNQVSQKTNDVRQTITTDYDISFDDVNTNLDLQDVFNQGLQDILDQYNDDDKVRLILSNEETNNGASTSFISIGNFKQQFYDGDSLVFDFDDMVVDTAFNYEADGLNLNVTIQKNIFSGGRGKIVSDKTKVVATKKSVLKINNDDDLCLGRCIVCELADRDNHPQKKQIRMGRKIQTELTHKLYEENGIEKCLATLEHIKQFEEALDISITIVDADQFNNIIYPDTKSPEYIPKETNVYLYKTKNHYDLITSKNIKGFFAKNNWCHKCKKPFTDINKHKCSFKCNICCSYDCDSSCFDFKTQTPAHECRACNRFFPTSKCIANHRKCPDGKKSVCDTIWKCQDCKKVMNRDKFPMETHMCGDYWCKNCNCLAHKDHKCYMMPKPIKPHSDKYIYFDFECDIRTNKHHTPNFCIAEYHGDPTPYEFRTCEEFCEWVFQEKHKFYTFIAHNGRGYDFQIIMRWIYKHTSLKPFTIYAGSKIMTFSVEGEFNIRFLDSLNFLTMKLEDMPGTFGIKELKKGFYPYWFNTIENFDYEGPLPCKRFYRPRNMKLEKKKEFNKWYDKLKKENYYYHHENETRSYCISDVDILRRSCELFRDLFIEVANIDPFRYTTIASVCMAIFKADYIIDDYDVKYRLMRWEKSQLQSQEEKKQYEENFNNKIREQVFKEKKIGVFKYQDVSFMRESFFGGRTNATKLKYVFKGNEEGKYADITSLYPSVNFYDDYPLGHPIHITSNFKKDKNGKYDISGYFGFIKCSVECPKDLYFPVLARKGKKLMFDLQDKKGTWATNELQKAVEKGYKITNIEKIYHFEETTNSLFKGYISKFLKIKQESSGLPDWVTKPNEDNCVKDYELDYILSLTEDQRTDLYIDLYHKNQGILMEKHKIKKNKGLRAIAKLCLNSLWGKFGQRSNMPCKEIIGSNENKKYWDLMFNEKYTSQDYWEIDEDRIEFTYKLKDDYVEDSFNTNIAIASFTTSSARLRLYEGLDLLKHQVLYHDTDSIVYVYDPDNPNHKKMEIGDYLGEWTDELEGCKMIGTFISGGPKNYSYETDDGEFHTKIKGFTLNAEAIQELNHNNMIDMIDNFAGTIGPVRKEDCYLTAEYDMIKREKDKSLTNYHQVKKYGFSYDKRQICSPDEFGNIDTIPWGYRA